MVWKKATVLIFHVEVFCLLGVRPVDTCHVEILWVRTQASVASKAMLLLPRDAILGPLFCGEVGGSAT